MKRRKAITLTPEEERQFLEESHTIILSTIDRHGYPHSVAMWYVADPDGTVLMTTFAKSQKAVNLRRDHRIACSVEAGESYDQLRGVAIEGNGVLIEDTDDDQYWAAAVSVFERYQAPYSDEMRPVVETMMHKRVVVRIDPVRVRSWDHRKLGLAPLPVGGSTARFL